MLFTAVFVLTSLLSGDMIEIRSKINNRLLHMVYRWEDLKEQREDVAPENQFIQVSALDLKKDKTFKPHRHIWKPAPRDRVVAQESWCVMSGKVLAHFYDLNDELLETVELNDGDISLTFEGGHTYTILEDARVYEYKTGPYEGQELDKVFLDG
jgi:hypothetical protein